MRSGIFVNGVETHKNPFRASFPQLIDIGIMGHIHGLSGLCEAAGIGCYQNGRDINSDNMTLFDFTSIAKQCSGLVDQFALGVRGDPDEHDDFEAILKTCHEHDIVANYTTSGYTFNKEKVAISKKYCGAVAVSWYRNVYTIAAIKLLSQAQVRTNIHYVLSNSTIDEAMTRIKDKSFPRVNASIFLLHKPQGLGSQKDVLTTDDPKVQEFFELLSKNRNYRYGIDSCMVPGMINYAANFDIHSLDTCDAARFSCYISSDMKMMPCSFDTFGKYHVDLREHTIAEAFESEVFYDFRSKLRLLCRNCSFQQDCMGGCSIMPAVVLCQRIAWTK